MQYISVLYNICSFETLLYKKEQKICKYIFYLSELLKSWEICKLNKTFANPQIVKCAINRLAKPRKIQIPLFCPSRMKMAFKKRDTFCKIKKLNITVKPDYKKLYIISFETWMKIEILFLLKLKFELRLIQ